MIQGQARADGHRGPLDAGTLKRGRKRAPEADTAAKPTPSELVIPVFGYKNHLRIDRHFGFIRTFTVTDAARHDGGRLTRLLDPDNTAHGVWADTAYRSQTNLLLLARRGLLPQFQRSKPRGRPMPPNMVRGNATRARVRVAVERVFATQKCRLGLVVRSVGMARATARLGLANLVTNMRRLVWLERRVPWRERHRPASPDSPILKPVLRCVRLSCDPTSLVRFRKRIGPDGMERLLAETVRAGLETSAVRASSLERISADTTVQPKAIAHP